MDEILSFTAVHQIKALILWTAIANTAGFYVQRVHHEDPYMRGSVLPGPQILYVIAHLMGWVLMLLPLYVWYKIGLGPAITLAVITFLVPIVVSTTYLLIRVPTGPMGLVCTPIAIGAFVMTVRAALQL